MGTKKALICGGGGFIGTHLASRLKSEGYWVRSVDIKKNEFKESDADEFLIYDLTLKDNCERALSVDGGFDEVYQLAADRGGAGYMLPGECDMMHKNMLINIYMVTEAIKLKRLPKYFFSSSVCIYRDMKVGANEIKEEDAYPAHPENEYGWEKLYSERFLLAHHRKYGIEPRIARFHTTYGPYAYWEGGREKAADALCRKASMAKDGGELEVWGDGKSVRCFTYIDDLINGIRALVLSDIKEPTNIGSGEYVTVENLANTVIKASGKNLKIKYTEGAVGVKSRNFSNNRIYSTGWRPKIKLEEGIAIHYKWVDEQVKKRYSQ